MKIGAATERIFRLLVVVSIDNIMEPKGNFYELAGMLGDVGVVIFG
jgi:hypothetical protein